MDGKGYYSPMTLRASSKESALLSGLWEVLEGKWRLVWRAISRRASRQRRRRLLHRGHHRRQYPRRRMTLTEEARSYRCPICIHEIRNRCRLVDILRAVIGKGGNRGLLGGLSGCFGRGAVGVGSDKGSAGSGFRDLHVVAVGRTASGDHRRGESIKLRIKTELMCASCGLKVA